MYTHDFTKDERTPVSIFWDESDDRMLVCEAVRTRAAVPAGDREKKDGGGADDDGKKDDEEAAAPATDIEVVIFFATTTHGLQMQDSFPRRSPYGPMIGFVVPRVYFRNFPDATDAAGGRGGPAGSSSHTVKVYSKIMKDFSFSVTQGKLDEAYRAVKTIGSASIWENMAHMYVIRALLQSSPSPISCSPSPLGTLCLAVSPGHPVLPCAGRCVLPACRCVKTKRLDVAEVCLGHMGHARGAAAVRESRKEGSVELSIGVLATELGLLDDAARLFRESGRHDYLNKLFQAAGLWPKAIKVAKGNDRIHLKNTHYQFAKHLESIGDIDRAIEHYERSETARTEVPRMLFSLGRTEV